MSKGIDNLINDIVFLKDGKINKLEAENAELRRQVEQMKCCGNCRRDKLVGIDAEPCADCLFGCSDGTQDNWQPKGGEG